MTFRLLDRVHARFLGCMFVMVLTSQATMVVDASVGGWLLGPEAVSTVDLVMPVYELFYALVMLLGAGACTVASVCLGRGDVAAVRRHFTAAALSLVAALLLLGMSIVVWRDAIAGMLSGGSSLVALTRRYLVAMVPYFVFAGLSIMMSQFVAMAGRPALVMVCSMVQFALNVGCDILLIKGMGLGIEALAVSSALASAAALLLLLTAYFDKGCPFRLTRCSPSRLAEALRENVRYGGGFVVVEMAYVVMVYAMNVLVIRFAGEEGLFGWSVVLMVYSTGDFASMAAQDTTLSLGGRLLGAGLVREAKRVHNRCMAFTLAWFALVLTGIFVSPHHVLPLFGSADVSLLPTLAWAAPAIVGVSMGNLFLVRLVQRGRLWWYVTMASALYLLVPAVTFLVK